jgi:hypothetical protein
MRIQNGFFMAIFLALAALTAFGSIYTEPFQRASQHQNAGFDALAHDLFDGLVAPAPTGSGAK